MCVCVLCECVHARMCLCVLRLDKAIKAPGENLFSIDAVIVFILLFFGGAVLIWKLIGRCHAEI